MLKGLLVDLALLAGPKIKFVRTVSEQSGIHLPGSGGKYWPTMAETDYIEARPHDWQKAIAAFVLGVSLSGIGAGGSNQVADRFVWRTEDHENFDGIMERESQSGVHPDEMRSDLSAIMRQPATYRDIAEEGITTARAEIVAGRKEADAIMRGIKLRMARNHLRRAKTDLGKYTRLADLEYKLTKLLCISYENPVPRKKVFRLKPVDAAEMAASFTPA